MQATVFTEADTQRAMAIWAEYQKTHDLSAFHEQAAGVDPFTGEVFAGDIMDRLWAEGRWWPLVFFQVGLPYYARVRGDAGGSGTSRRAGRVLEARRNPFLQRGEA